MEWDRDKDVGKENKITVVQDLKLKLKDTWSSLVYGTYLENKNFSKSREFKSHSIRYKYLF